MLKWIAMLGKKGPPPEQLDLIRQSVAGLMPGESLRPLEELSYWLRFVSDRQDLDVAEARAAGDLLLGAGQEVAARANRELLLLHVTGQGEREGTLWVALYQFHLDAAAVCNYLIDLTLAQGTPEERYAVLPQLLCRAIRSLADAKKVLQYRYMPVDPRIWQGLAACYRTAHELQLVRRHCPLYPPRVNLTSVAQEMARTLLLDCAEPACLSPLQMDLADRIVSTMGTLLETDPGFESESGPEGGGLFCFDWKTAGPPSRWSGEDGAEMLVFGLGAGWQRLLQLYELLEQNAWPPEIERPQNLGEAGMQDTLRHLLTQWRREPRRRSHERSRILAKAGISAGFDQVYEQLKLLERIKADPGLDSQLTALKQQEADDLEKHGYVTKHTREATAAFMSDLQAPAQLSWQVQDVSHGGYGFLMSGRAEGLIRIVQLVGVLVDGSVDLDLGIIRRLGRDHRLNPVCGVQRLDARNMGALLLQDAGLPAAFQGSIAGIRALFLPGSAETGAKPRLITAPGSVILNLPLAIVEGAATGALIPTGFVERTDEYDLVAVTYAPDPS